MVSHSDNLTSPENLSQHSGWQKYNFAEKYLKLGCATRDKMCRDVIHVRVVGGGHDVMLAECWLC